MFHLHLNKYNKVCELNDIKVVIQLSKYPNIMFICKNCCFQFCSDVMLNTCCSVELENYEKKNLNSCSRYFPLKHLNITPNEMYTSPYADINIW